MEEPETKKMTTQISQSQFHHEARQKNCVFHHHRLTTAHKLGKTPTHTKVIVTPYINNS